MELEQIKVVGLKPPERVRDLRRRSLLRLPINFGHQKRLVPIAVLQSFAHADFAVAAVVVPAVVEEVDATVECGTDDADALLFAGRNSYVVAAESDHRNALAAAPKTPIGDPVFLPCRQKL